ncbi:MAG: DUF5119 domain-containing protein [Rikenellaceae bacterium]
MREFIAVALLLCTVSCTHRPLTDEVCSGSYSGVTAIIPVAVDWSISGISPTENSYDTSGDYVHRVSLRFFPHDGTTPFDRYLEESIYSGTIELPAGVYSVVAFNESIYDSYWNGVFDFVEVDDFDNFMVQLVDEDEEYSTEAYKLASWSLEELEVTDAMVTASRTKGSTISTELENIILQPLTCYVRVTANIENLTSAQGVYCDVSGFSNKTYMASGESHADQTTHAMELITRSYTDDENTYGSITHERLILTKSTHEEAEFNLKFEILLTDGTTHSPDEPLEFNVNHQVTRYASDDFELSADFSLPEVSGGIDVEGWENEEVVTIY